MVSRYQKRISGPLLDRIDTHVEVPRVEYDKLNGGRLGEKSEDIRAKSEAGSHHRRSGGLGADRDGASGRSDSISAAAADL